MSERSISEHVEAYKSYSTEHVRSSNYISSSAGALAPYFLADIRKNGDSLEPPINMSYMPHCMLNAVILALQKLFP